MYYCKCILFASVWLVGLFNSTDLFSLCVRVKLVLKKVNETK